MFTSSYRNHCFDLFLESLKRRRNFFPIDNPNLETVTTHNQTLIRLRVGDDDKNDVNKNVENVENVDENKSAKIDDNVALTVLIPGGKECFAVFHFYFETHFNMSYACTYRRTVK
jgi:hypothetical protein